MSTATINIRKTRYCAICRHWYDPTNQYIEPINPALDMWEIERGAKCKCMKKTGGETSATYCCSKFQPKL